MQTMEITSGFVLHAHGHTAGFAVGEILLHATVDFLKLLPFLFLTYLLTEWLSRAAGPRVRYAVSRGGRFAPLFGGLLGAIPQCGFSAATAGLYAARLLSLGTLLSVFLSTSDEMLPILLAGGVSPLTALRLVAFKCAVGILLGFAVDLLLALFSSGRARLAEGEDDFADGAEAICTCPCCSGGPREGFRGVLCSALRHTATVSLYLYLTMLVFEAVLHLIGTEALASALSEAGALTVLFAALCGLIPNCAVSVVLTELWIAGAISTGALLAGLLVGAGVGLLVVIRLCRPLVRCLTVIGLLLLFGVGIGLLVDLTGLSPLLFGR